MRFGWLTLSLSPSPEEDAERIDQQIEQVRFAERLGFGDVWLTEHYFTGESVYNDALLFASAVAMRWAAYEAGLDAGGHDATTKARLLAQSALWRNVYVAESNAQAEHELSALLLQTPAHMMHVRAAYNPADFTIDPTMLNPWADPGAATRRSNSCSPPGRATARPRGCVTRSPSCAMPACSTCCARPASAT